MTVGKAGPRRPVATGCGAGSTAKTSGDKKPARTAVSTGCGSSSSAGWKAKTVAGGKSGKTTGLSERAQQQLEKAKTPAKPAKPVRTGC